MQLRDVLPRANNSPLRSVVSFFVLWKVFLLLIACLSPGPGYDTSTTILLHRDSHSTTDLSGHVGSALRIEHVLGKLLRWDALYFAKIAQRGYSFEQEWAFGWGFTRLVAVISQQFLHSFPASVSSVPIDETLVAVIIAHVSHLLSALVLYRLTKLIFPKRSQTRLALVSACLHIISPAGLFLSAPYAESAFSFLNFLGFFYYAESLRQQKAGHSAVSRDIAVLSSGVCFGIATTFRSNGLLSGLLFVYDVAIQAWNFPSVGVHGQSLQRLAALVAGGCLIAMGYIVPQYLAYTEYCSIHSVASERRVWCMNTVPSIYAWVQSCYWNVGFLKYWTFSNLPLFILAAPMLLILGISGSWAWGFTAPCQGAYNGAKSGTLEQKFPPSTEEITQDCLRRFALPQLALAALAFTSYHVQIITRISSGYVIWYWWLALMLTSSRGIKAFGMNWNVSMVVIRWMVTYAVVQGGFFATFLPPA